jgi:hypothetical protein
MASVTSRIMPGLRPGIAGYCSSDRMNLLVDGCAHVLREQILRFQGFPFGYGTFCRFGGDLPKRACWDSRRVGEAAHLVGVISERLLLSPKLKPGLSSG